LAAPFLSRLSQIKSAVSTAGREESDCVERREAGRSSLFKKRPQSIGVSVNEPIPETRIAALNVTANS
jgi:hypothetical protein